MCQSRSVYANGDRLLIRPSLLRVLALALLLVALPTRAADLFVSVSGSDSNPGSQRLPLRTLVAAAARVQPGDTVFIRGGVYHETLAPIRSGTPAAPIIFSRYGDEVVEIDARGLPQGVMLWRVSHIVVRGLLVRSSGRAGIHIHHHQDQPDNGSDYNRIENNQVIDSGSHGIYVAGDHNVVVNNSVTGSGNSGRPLAGHGIYVMGRDNLLTGNQVERNLLLGIRMEGVENRIIGNFVSGNGRNGVGIWVDSPYEGRKLVISDNLLTKNVGDAIQVNGGGDGAKPEQIQIAGNQIQANGTNGLVLINGMSGIEVRNNRFSGNFLHFVRVDVSSALGLKSTENTFSGAGRFDYQGRIFSNLGAYQAATGLEQGSQQQP